MSTRFKSRMSPSRRAEIERLVSGEPEPMMMTATGHRYINLHMHEGLGSLLFTFIFLMLTSYLVYYVWNPTFVRGQGASHQFPDLYQVLMYSVVTAIVLMVLIYFLLRM